MRIWSEPPPTHTNTHVLRTATENRQENLSIGTGFEVLILADNIFIIKLFLVFDPKTSDVNLDPDT